MIFGIGGGAECSSSLFGVPLAIGAGVSADADEFLRRVLRRRYWCRQFLGEEVLHVMRGMDRTDSNVEIYGGVKTIRCPGRTRTNEGRAGFEGTYKDADPVEIKLDLLRIGDIAIGGVNAEVFNPIAQRLKKESPYARTMMATLTNGSARSGYIPNDSAYGMDTFEVLSSRLKPGCAESAIVNGILDLMADSRERK